jgi:hypothetical protein
MRVRATDVTWRRRCAASSGIVAKASASTEAGFGGGGLDARRKVAGGASSWTPGGRGLK